MPDIVLPATTVNNTDDTHQADKRAATQPGSQNQFSTSAGIEADKAAMSLAESDLQDPVIIAGGGPVGIRAAQELVRLGHAVVLFNAERWQPYNRVQLTPLLSGEVQLGTVYQSESFVGDGSFKRYDGVSIIDVDRVGKYVLTSGNRVFKFSKLVLALGSRAFVPDIPGHDLDGVFTFRNFDDTEALLARSLSARSVVVIGGGLLGLEAARGLRKRGAAVTVVEHENRLMPRQLDMEAAALLAGQIESFGVCVYTSMRVLELFGSDRVEEVVLSNDERLRADTVVICTGVRSNTQLPAAIGLDFSRGVRVDDDLQTSDPNIYAIGECAEHKGHVYGLVGPGFEQAVAASRHINRLLRHQPETVPVTESTEHSQASYIGSIPATKLKILGIEVFSMGDYESLEQSPGVRSHVFAHPASGIYRRLLVQNGVLAAALSVGDWDDSSRVQHLISSAKRIHFLQLLRFERTGSLWSSAVSNDVMSMPRSAIICNCTGTTKGAIDDAIRLGSSTVAHVRVSTGANSVCGSCKTEINQLLGGPSQAQQAVGGWKYLLAASSMALVVALFTILLQPVPLATSFNPDELLRFLWFDTTAKQWSGYTLLALTAMASVLGLRKRIRFLSRLGTYDGWRVIHLCIGFIITLILFVHTGFRLGSNLNFWLMSSFLACLFFGAVAGLITGSEHVVRDKNLLASVRQPRTIPMWIHILAFWPLPVLLILHVLSVYTY